MEKITSFTIDHIKLEPGVYVSRKDHVGQEVITTFDLRMTSPNDEPVMNTAEMHTIEHLMAVYLREHPVWAEKTIYVGPMGCRTGMYVIFKGDLEPQDVAAVIRESYDYLDHNLGITKIECRKFVDEVLSCLKPENMVYPRQNG